MQILSRAPLSYYTASPLSAAPWSPPTHSALLCDWLGPTVTQLLETDGRPGSSTASRRNASAAALRLGACSACATTCSTSSRVPGSRAARQSGSRLKVVWLSG